MNRVGYYRKSKVFKQGNVGEVLSLDDVMVFIMHKKVRKGNMPFRRVK